MIPPRRGPIPAVAITNPIIPPSHFILSERAISGPITMVREYIPDPPSLCKARHAMSWFIDWENPQPKENARKITNTTAKAFLQNLGVGITGYIRREWEK
jgi:hypothetical protein